MCWPYCARLVFTSLPKGANKNFEKWENLDFEIFDDVPAILKNVFQKNFLSVEIDFYIIFFSSA